MRISLFAAAVAAFFTTALAANPAQAITLAAPSGLQAAADELSVTEKVTYGYGWGYRRPYYGGYGHYRPWRPYYGYYRPYYRPYYSYYRPYYGGYYRPYYRPYYPYYRPYYRAYYGPRYWGGYGYRPYWRARYWY